MDFEERLLDYIESLNLPIPIFNDSNNENTSLALYSLPGSRVVKGFMDGIKEKQMNFEIQVKTRQEDRDRATETLSFLSEKLQELDSLNSNNKSFDFEEIAVSSEIYLNEAQTDGFLYFRITFQALLTIYK